MIVSFRVYAGDGERFAQDAFESAIGREVEFHIGIDSIAGVLTDAAVANDGSYVLVTVESDMPISVTGVVPDGH